MKPALLALVLESFTDAELAQVYTRMGLNYNSVQGDKKTKAKSLTLHCLERDTIPELVKICREMQPDSDTWDFILAPFPTAARFTARFQGEITQWGEINKNNLPRWWNTFYEAVDKARNDDELIALIKGLPPEERLFAENIAGSFKKEALSKFKSGTQPIRSQKRTWLDRLRGK